MSRNHKIRFQKVSLVIVVLAVLVAGSVVFAQGDSRPELDRESPIALNPAGGSEVGFVYQAYLSPQQEGGEEEDTPAAVPPQFKSTAPSVARNDRPDRGHATIEFTRDLSKAYVYLSIADVKVEEIVMLHLHCGRPGQLGPIVVDFSMAGSLAEYLADGTMKIEITNEDIEMVLDHATANPIDAFTVGCPIVPDAPSEKVKTIAGLEQIARENELYFNLHTAGQVYFGDIRGQFYLVEEK